jgi:ADP-ribose 1''-phosphate phosphatase
MAKLTYVTGDLFTAPRHSILVHACNTVGSWGGGIALVFRDKYPTQFEQYKAHCQTHGNALLGTCLLIPGDEHDIACLFTSHAYGRRKDKPEQILAATRTAMQDLMSQNKVRKEMHAWYINLRFFGSYMTLKGCSRINSGKFGVPWEETEAILKELDATMIVYDPLNPPT